MGHPTSVYSSGYIFKNIWFDRACQKVYGNSMNVFHQRLLIKYMCDRIDKDEDI